MINSITMLVLYKRNASTVFGCLMDCSKEFNKIQQNRLFKKMIDTKVPFIIVRLLINMYKRQTLDVRWKGHYPFSVIKLI